MNIGIDIDDTLTSLSAERQRLGLEYIKNHGWKYTLERTDTTLFNEMFGFSYEDGEKFWHDESVNLFSHAVPRDHASTVIRKMKELGYKIFIVTSRSLDTDIEPYRIAYDWLIHNDIMFDELIIGQKDKASICIDKKIDIFIDDLPKHMVSLDAIGCSTILMENLHNTNVAVPSSTVRVKDWLQILTVVESLAGSKCHTDERT